MHTARACVLACIDYRFQDSIQSWLRNNEYLGCCDEIVVAGCIHDIILPQKKSYFESLIRQFEISVKLHNPEELLIFEHQDCGGYALDKSIPSGLDIEKDMHLHYLGAKKADEVLHKLFPELDIRFYYVGLDSKVRNLA